MAICFHCSSSSESFKKRKTNSPLTIYVITHMECPGLGINNKSTRSAGGIGIITVWMLRRFMHSDFLINKFSYKQIFPRGMFWTELMIVGQSRMDMITWRACRSTTGVDRFYPRHPPMQEKILWRPFRIHD